MIQIEIDTVGAAEARRAFANAKPATFDRWYATLRKHAFRAVRTIQTRYRGAAATSPTATRQGTGALRASYSQQTTRTATGAESIVGLMRSGAQGQALRYGAVHEEGATIRPTKGKMLAIPLPTIRSPSGIAPPPRSFPDTFIIKGRFAGGVIAQRLAGGGIRPLFALRNQVTIPARPPGGAINAAVAAERPELEAQLERDVIETIAGTGGRA